MDKTLRELCTSLNVKRRAVQGYEKEGLVAATGKTDRGYLLYDEAAQMRIAEIKRYQNYGFKVREIGRVIDARPEVKREELTKKLIILKAEHREVNLIIKELEEYINLL